MNELKVSVCSKCGNDKFYTACRKCGADWYNKTKTSADPRLKEAIAEIKTTEYYDDWGGESGRKEQKRILNILEKWIPELKED